MTELTKEDLDITFDKIRHRQSNKHLYTKEELLRRITPILESSSKRFLHALYASIKDEPRYTVEDMYRHKMQDLLKELYTQEK